METWYEKLDLLLKSRTPLIWIRSKEEERLYKILSQTCNRLEIKRLVSWDCVNGLSGVINEEGSYSNNPLGVLNWVKEQNIQTSSIILLKDFHKFYDDPTISRTIKELSFKLRKTNNNIVFSSYI